MKNLFSVENKKVLVTGGTRGIGLSLVETFNALGADVIIHGETKELAKEIGEKLNIRYCWGDFTSESEIKNLIKQVSEYTDVLDVVVNNAGAEFHAEVEDMTEDLYEKANQINVKSPLILMKNFLPLLKNSKHPSIINITSIHDVVPVRGNGAYCLSKASLAMLTKVGSLEYAKYGIRVNSVAPGAIRTDMNREIVKEMPFDEWIPMGRVGDVEEIAYPAVFLASEASSYMTGATLYVDGGYKENLLRY